MPLYTFGLDNGREVDVQASSVDSATLEVARAYPGVAILGFTVTETEIDDTDTDTTDETGTDDSPDE